MVNNFFRCDCGQVEQIGGRSDESYMTICGGAPPPVGMCGDCWGKELAAKTPPKATVTEVHIPGESVAQRALRLEHEQQQRQKPPNA